MRRIAPVLAIASLVAASGAAATTQSGLRGIVTRGPISPICVAGQPCDAPVPGLTLVFTRGGSQAARTRTSDTGTYGAYRGVVSTQWLGITGIPQGTGYMSNLWFGDPATAAAGLPGC